MKDTILDKHSSKFFPQANLNISCKFTFFRENGTSCQGLMTGHGDSSALYQCYDTMTNIFEKVRTWLNESENRNEVIVFYFGELR